MISTPTSRSPRQQWLRYLYEQIFDSAPRFVSAHSSKEVLEASPHRVGITLANTRTGQATTCSLLMPASTLTRQNRVEEFERGLARFAARLQRDTDGSLIAVLLRSQDSDSGLPHLAVGPEGGVALSRFNVFHGVVMPFSPHFDELVLLLERPEDSSCSEWYFVLPSQDETPLTARFRCNEERESVIEARLTVDGDQLDVREFRTIDPRRGPARPVELPLRALGPEHPGRFTPHRPPTVGGSARADWVRSGMQRGIRLVEEFSATHSSDCTPYPGANDSASDLSRSALRERSNAFDDSLAGVSRHPPVTAVGQTSSQPPSAADTGPVDDLHRHDDATRHASECSAAGLSETPQAAKAPGRSPAINSTTGREDRPAAPQVAESNRMEHRHPHSGPSHEDHDQTVVLSRAEVRQLLAARGYVFESDAS